MAHLHLETIIHANQKTVFNLARSIDLHLESAEETKEHVVCGRSGGLIELGERTRWRAKHLGFWQELEVEIVEMEPFRQFVDVMVDGPFRYMEHRHTFNSPRPGVTRMVDDFRFASPYGPVGQLFDRLFLSQYMYHFLVVRNEHIRRRAEGA